MLVLAASLVAVAPVSAPQPPGVEVAIVWWEREGEGDLALREELREALAERLGLPAQLVRDQAFEDARALAPHRQARALGQLHGQLREELDGADLDFREGRFEAARTRLGSVLARLHARPELPGAAASAREAHLLLAKIAWAAGEFEGAEAALGDALRLDPRAQLSSREAPPGLIARYAELQVTLLEGAPGWSAPELVWAGEAPPDSQAIEVEIDGVAGLRPLPPGPHFVRVNVAGHAPMARVQEAGQPVELAELERLLGTDAADSSAAICELLGLEHLVVAAAREGRVALQVRACARGYGAPWFADALGAPLGEGLAAAFAGPFDAPEAALLGDWPPLEPVAASLDDPRPRPEPRPWYRKGWIWGTSVGALALVSGAVAAGVLLGGAGGPPRLEVDADDFIGAR